MKKGVFALFLFLYLLLFNLVVLSTVSKTGITGGAIFIDSKIAVQPNVLLPLLLFNIAIVVLFSTSYYFFNNTKALKKLIGKKKRT